MNRPGRPRDPQAAARIMTAALAVVSDDGLAGFTIDAVARRAGVGKATIYRRWPSREALLVDAWSQLVDHEIAPDTGSLRGDLLAFHDHLAEQARRGRLAETIPHLIAAGRADVEIGRLLDEFMDLRRNTVRAALRRAVDRGEIPTPTDEQFAIDLVIGPVLFRLVCRGLITEGPAAAATVDACIAALHASTDTLDDPHRPSTASARRERTGPSG